MEFLSGGEPLLPSSEACFFAAVGAQLSERNASQFAATVNRFAGPAQHEIGGAGGGIAYPHGSCQSGPPATGQQPALC
jgi:hypothetical protein